MTCPQLSQEGNVLLLLWPRWSWFCFADKICFSGFHGLLFWFSYLSCQFVPVLGQLFPVSTPSCSSILAHLPFFLCGLLWWPLIHWWCNSPLPHASPPCHSPDQNLKVKNSSLCLQEVAVSGPCRILPASFQYFWLIMFHPYFKVFAGVRLSSNSRPFPIISTPFSTKSEISSSWTTTYSLQDELQPSVTLASSQLSLSSWYNDS